jgi:magnesium chelatase subunit I
VKSAVQKLGAQGNPALIASATEFILEGLHLNRKLNKDRRKGQLVYRR